MRIFAAPMFVFSLLALFGCASLQTEEKATSSLDGKPAFLSSKEGVKRETVSADVEKILKKLEKWVEETRNLKFKTPVEKQILSSEEMTKLRVEAWQNEGGWDQSRNNRKALVKLGLLGKGAELIPPNFTSTHLAGIYDYETKQLYLIRETIQAIQDHRPKFQMSREEAAGEIVIHELIHALQDQHFNLKAFMEARGGNNDRLLAAQTIVESEARLLQNEYRDWILYRRSFLYPIPGEATRTFLVHHNNPALIPVERSPSSRISRVRWVPTLFKYQSGLFLIHKLYRQGGWEKVNALYRDPPQSTEQILHPEKFLQERDGPTDVRLPEIPDLDAKWRPIWTDTTGELYLSILLREFLSVDEARLASEGWDGDQIRVYEKRDGSRTLSVGMTIWDSEKDAKEFLVAYLHLIEKKFPQRTLKEFMPEQRVSWETSEGMIYLEQRGDKVLLVEGADQEDLSTILETVWEKTGFIIEKP